MVQTASENGAVMSEKQLASTVEASAHQKEWFSQLRRDVFEKQKPYAIVQADMPFELFQAMGIPTVSNQWWAALISAKRLNVLTSSTRVVFTTDSATTAVFRWPARSLAILWKLRGEVYLSPP
jgi:hypothetical protein